MRQGRFSGALEDVAAALNASVDFDRRLYRVDIAGSKAHARMLASRGILSADEAASICKGLDQVGEEIASGTFTLDPQLEDIHMNIERRLVELVGTAGARLHTAR